MPCVSTTLPDIEQSVARPIIFGILNQIFETTGLSKDSEIIYVGKRNIARMPGSTIDDEGKKDAKFQSGRFTFVEVDEKYEAAAIQEIQAHSYEQKPIFCDGSLGFSLRPIYTPSDVTMTVRYRSNSETEVRRWVANMVVRASRGSDVNLHRIDYSYPVPYGFLMLAEDIWKLREAVEPYGESFQQYIVNHSSGRLAVISNQAGKYSQLVVNERKVRIQGFFDFVGIPEEPTLDSESGMWEIQFKYTFKYERPDAVLIFYPVSVHNQLIPEKYTDHIDSEFDPALLNASRSNSYEDLERFELDSVAMATRPPIPFIKIPHYDDFKPQNPPPGTATVISALCFVDDDKETLMDMNDLGDFIIDADVLEFLKSEYPHMTKLYHSFFNVAIYNGEFSLVGERVIVTPDLKIKSTKALDLRRVYHVRVSIIAEVHMLLQAALVRLSKFPKAFTKVISSINELLRTNPDFNLLPSRNQIEPWELTEVYRVLTGGLRTNALSPDVSPVMYEDQSLSKWLRQPTATFLKDLDPVMVKEYLRNKRNCRLSVSCVGVIAHRNIDIK